MQRQQGLHVGLGVLAGYVLYSAFSALGVAAVAVNLFTPLPAAYLGMRYGVRTGVVVVALTGLIVLMQGGPAQMALFFMQFGIPAALLPALFGHGIGWDRAVALVVAAMVAAGLVGLILLAASEGTNPITVASHLIDKEIAGSAEMMTGMFDQADLPPAQREEVGRSVEQMAAFMQRVYPGVVIVVSGLMVLGLVFLLTAASRGRYVVPGCAFSAWKSPEMLVWLLIAAGFTVAFGDGLIAGIALNLLVVLVPVYFLQGLAVLDHYFRRKAFSPLMRGIGYVLVTVINPLPMVVAGIGVFDLWADFRKPRQTES